MRSEIVAGARRVVIKVGSGVLTDHQGVISSRVEAIVTDIARLMKSGYQIVLVSSGAVAAGRTSLTSDRGPLSISLKQAAAAIGQPRLMRLYKEAFKGHEITAAQVLLTRDDLANRRRYLNARNTLMTLLDHGVIPIINENDTVVVEEIRFGDNDNLSALVTAPLDADLLIIMSDIDGLYDSDPGKNPQARLIPVVPAITTEIEAMAGGSTSGLGTGGMATKIRAAKKASHNGVPTIIVNGKKPGILADIFAGKECGTLFLPERNRLSAKKHWIAYARRPKGALILDPGACNALTGGRKSLLSSGITGVEGSFDRGETIRLMSPEGKEFARGSVSYSSEELQKIAGRKSSEIATILGYHYGDEIVHRDNLVLL